MTYPLPALVLVPGTTQQIQLANPLMCQAILVSNKSVFDIIYEGFGATGARWLIAGVEYLFQQQGQSSGVITLTSYNDLNISPAPTGIILVTEYFAGDVLPTGEWSVSIPNLVSANVTAFLINSGYATPTNMVSGTSASNTGGTPEVSINNDGSMIIQQYYSGTYHNFMTTVTGANPLNLVSMYIGDSSHYTEVEGGLRVDGSAAIGFAIYVPNAYGSILDGGAIVTDGIGNIQSTAGTFGAASNGDILDASSSTFTYLKSRGSGGKILFQMPDGTTCFQFAGTNNSSALASGGTLSSGGDVKLGTGNSGLNNNLYFPDGSRLASYHGMSGSSGSATSHNCPKQPQYYTAVPNPLSNSPTTICVTAINSTTITVNTGSGANWIGFSTTFN